MSNLQKIVVLCVTVLIVGGAYLYTQSSGQQGRVLTDSDINEQEQIDPPSLELDAGPSDTDDTEPLSPTEEPGGSSLPPTDVGMEFPIVENDVEEAELVACTMDAKQCPDGSFVGRTGPTCEFAACPDVSVVEEEITPVTHVFDVTGVNFAFNVTEIKVKKGDIVTINFESVGGFHDWVVDEFDAATDQVKAGNETSVTFVASEAGTFEYYCSVGSHRANGMVGSLIVE